MISSGALGRLLDARVLRPSDASIRGASHDSRAVRPGDLFVAIRGERTDGHRYLAEAFDVGAAAALISQTDGLPDAAHDLIVVPDVVAALATWAAARRAELRATFVGITGSNGKTTTRRLLYHLLGADETVYTAPKNFNTEIGLPLALFAMPDEARIGLFELGTEAPGDIKILADLLRPSVGLVTGIGPGHLDRLGTVGAVANEKWDLVRALPSSGWAALNADAAELRALRREAQCPLTEVGTAHGTVRVHVESPVPRLTVRLSEPDVRLETGLLGEHHAVNVALAAVAAHRLGVSSGRLIERCATFEPTNHRLVALATPFGAVLDDTYNANPASTAGALRVLAQFGDSRAERIFVFGEMLDLGEAGDRYHAEILSLAGELGIDRIVPIGERAIRACRAVGMSVSPPADPIESIRAALAADRPNVVLVKGSRALALERVVDALRRGE